MGHDLANDVHKFRWGKKRGVGGSKRNIQFYESFTIDDVDYSLFDCVYVDDMKASEPYIGKIVKIWEQPDKKKKVKILWFFRPYEVQNYLEDTPLEKEIFLATGEGIGLFNINPLEAIVGKCSVICTSKDERNRQPSNEELDMADYIFFRTFNVGSHKISEIIDDQIAGVAAKDLLNQIADQHSISKFEKKGDSGIASPSTDILLPASKLNPLNSLENRVDGEIESLSTSTKRHGVIVHKSLEGQHPLKDNQDDKSISNLVLVDDRLSKKPRLIDSPIEALNDTILRKHKVESNGCVSSIHLDKESSKVTNDALVGHMSSHEMKLIQAPTTEVPNDASSRKQKFSGDGFSKESSGVADALIGNRILKKKLIDDPIDVLNDAGARKQKLDSNGDASSKEIVRSHKESFEKHNLVQKKTKPLDTSLQDSSLLIGDSKKNDYEILEVTRKPDADRSRWFKSLPWEDRLKKADEQGTLVFVENLDPTYTSSEVEDIMYRTFQKSCTARVIQQATFQNPNYGQAYVIFRTREAADLVVSKINKGCLQLSNGSPLLCSKGMLKVPKSSIYGHFSVERSKLQTREMRMAVSTSHCSQPNTIEYEMAMEWVLLHEKSSKALKTLHKDQADRLREIKKTLKTK